MEEGGGRRLVTKRTRLRGVEYGSDELMGSLSEEDEGDEEGRPNLSAYRRPRIADLHVELVELMV